MNILGMPIARRPSIEHFFTLQEVAPRSFQIYSPIVHSAVRLRGAAQGPEAGARPAVVGTPLVLPRALLPRVADLDVAAFKSCSAAVACFSALCQSLSRRLFSPILLQHCAPNRTNCCEQESHSFMVSSCKPEVEI